MEKIDCPSNTRFLIEKVAPNCWEVFERKPYNEFVRINSFLSEREAREFVLLKTTAVTRHFFDEKGNEIV